MVQPDYYGYVVHVDADFWKTFTHNRLETPMSEVGAMTLYRDRAEGHFRFCKHLLAEQAEEEWRASGKVTVWKQVHRENHHLDSTALALAAAHKAGARLMEEREKPQQIQQPQSLEEWQRMIRGQR